MLQNNQLFSIKYKLNYINRKTTSNYEDINITFECLFKNYAIFPQKSDKS